HDGGIDADHLPVDVQKRPPGVARIDGSVGLDEVLVGFNAHVGAAGGRYDADSHGTVQTKGIADGNSPLPDFKLVRITENRYRKIGRIDLDNGDVGFLVRADNLGVIHLVIGELDLNALGIAHDMAIGYDVAVLADQKTRAEASVLPGLRSAEEILEKRVGFKKRLYDFSPTDR